MLRLRDTLEWKIAQAEAAVGASNVLPDRQLGPEVNLHDPASVEKEFEDLLDRRGASVTTSGEEFRRRLFRELVGSDFLKQKVKELPYGAGSGFINSRARSNGYVFCVKIGDHPDPWFRFVKTDEDWSVTNENGEPVIRDEQLFNLLMADPKSPNQERQLSEEAYSKAFDAWEVAQSSIYDAWSRLTDPNNLQAEPPLSFRDAIEFVRKEGGELGAESQSDLLARLRSVPSNRVSRSMRSLLNEEMGKPERLARIKSLLDLGGVKPSPEPTPLPEVNPSEIRLVAWMAVQKANDHGS
jgi:hypothetical protein